MAYVPGSYITIDEQFLSCTARCILTYRCLINRISLESKYLFNSFPYLRKDESKNTWVTLPKYVVTKLMQPIFKPGYNITSDNFFTRLDVALHLIGHKFSNVGTVR